MYTVDSPIIQEALTAWHEAGRERFKTQYPNSYEAGNYDSDTNRKTVADRKKYIALDTGAEAYRSGAFLVDKATGDVYAIKGYGVRGRKLMHIDRFVEYWKGATSDSPYQLTYVKNFKGE